MLPPPLRPAAAALVLVFLACLETSSGLCIGARRAPGGPARRWEESFDTLEDIDGVLPVALGSGFPYRSPAYLVWSGGGVAAPSLPLRCW